MRPLRAALLSALAACAGTPAATPQPPGAVAPRDLPELAWLPAEPSYALVAARTADLALAVRELLAGLGLFLDESIAELDTDLRRALGVSPLQHEELERAGIDPERGAALWSTGLLPTLALPVRDRAALSALIERARPARGLSVRRFGDHDVYRLRLGTRHALDWVLIDGWLLVHIAERRREPIGAWAIRLLGGPPNERGAAPDLLAAATAARRHLAIPPDDTPRVIDARRIRPGVVGVARIDRLWPLLARALPRAAAGCRRILAPRARLLVAADMSWRGGTGMIAVELADDTAAELGRALAPAPPPGVAALRADAGAWLELDVDPRWPAALALRTGCPLTPGPLLAQLRRLEQGGVRALRLAVAEVDLGSRTARAGLHLQLADPAAADALVARVPLARPGPSESIAGVDVNTLEVPLMPTIRYHRAGAGLSAALGTGIMEVLLGPGPPPPGRTVLAAGLVPQRFPELAELLRLTSTWLGLGGYRYYDRTTQRLHRWESGQIRLLAEGSELVLTLAMRLR